MRPRNINIDCHPANDGGYVCDLRMDFIDGASVLRSTPVFDSKGTAYVEATRKQREFMERYWSQDERWES